MSDDILPICLDIASEEVEHSCSAVTAALDNCLFLVVPPPYILLLTRCLKARDGFWSDK